MQLQTVLYSQNKSNWFNLAPLKRRDKFDSRYTQHNKLIRTILRRENYSRENLNGFSNGDI